MNVLLVQPGERKGRFAHPFGRVEPLSLESVGGSLKDVADVELIDMRFSGRDELEETVRSKRIDACGITSTFTIDFNETIRTAEFVKSINPEVFVFVGGHHPTLCPSEFLRPSVDAIVMGEGEITVRELIACLSAGGDLREVAGLTLNRGTQQIVTAKRPLAARLDDLPLPARGLASRYAALYRLIVQQPISTLETSRGCPYRCSFCSVWVFYDRKVRTKSPARVMAELREVVNDQILIVDDNFFSVPRRAMEIGNLIREAGVMKKYMIQARSDSIVRHPALLDLWADIGLRSVFLGFEKSDQAGLDNVDKQNTVENNEEALHMLRGRGIEPVASFIVDPESTGQEIGSLREYVRKLKLGMPFFTIFTPLPGTEAFGEHRERLLNVDRDLFDLLHPVLPTRLKSEEFASEMARLYRSAYPFRLAVSGAAFLLMHVARGHLSLRDWRQLVHDWRVLTDQDHYLDGMQSLPGSSTQ